MCGISGAVFELIKDDPEALLRSMNNALQHRGPDDSGIYWDDCFGLAHARLSIIDLSDSGRQPMSTEDGRYVIVFNGEIYNFQGLRKELSEKGYCFSTGTDTEVLLNLYKEYREGCLQKLRGMFAFAIWDNKEKELFLCRDRIGKKPLYYFYDGTYIAFASEIKSILKIPSVGKEIAPTAVVDYLKYLYVPHPKSIYKNIYKLEPGHFLVYKNGKVHSRKYWDIDFSTPLSGNADDIADELLSVISDSVRTRLISDVPLGAFLSGGIDSSGIVSLMSELENEPVKTCSIGFNEASHNEAVFAKEFAERRNADHHEFYIDEDGGLGNTIKRLIWHFDEPFADSSMVPTYHVSRVARSIVTVALSGDGGDENFGGYQKYSIDQFEHKVRSAVPHFLLNILRSLFESSEKGHGKKICSLSAAAMMSPAEGFCATNTFASDAFLSRLLSDSLKSQLKGYDSADHTLRYYDTANTEDHLSKILYTDLKSYLPGDILVKVDRMSMANSLEVRAPLLDHKVIEFAARIPSFMKIKGNEKKIILKKAFNKILPSDLMKRKKQGFEVPLGKWFRMDLKQMAYDYLFNREYMEDFFNVSEIKRIWNNHQENRGDYGTNLWTLLMFSIWFEEFMN